MWAYFVGPQIMITDVVLSIGSDRDQTYSQQNKEIPAIYVHATAKQTLLHPYPPILLCCPLSIMMRKLKYGLLLAQDGTLPFCDGL
jgi:hypothetical protein